MYAIAFDLKIAELKKNYGEPYNGTYQEINEELKKAGIWPMGPEGKERSPTKTRPPR